MTVQFALFDEKQTRLWDYGWFSVSEFVVEGPVSTGCDPIDIVRAFLLSPLSRRWFCTHPDPWGGDTATHGPYLWDRLSADWYAPLAPGELPIRVASVLQSSEFNSPPSDEQSSHVFRWAASVEGRGDTTFVLTPPTDARVRVEMDVFLVFVEFMCVTADRRSLTVAVLGYD